MSRISLCKKLLRQHFFSPFDSGNFVQTDQGFLKLTNWYFVILQLTQHMHFSFLIKLIFERLRNLKRERRPQIHWRDVQHKRMPPLVILIGCLLAAFAGQRLNLLQPLICLPELKVQCSYREIKPRLAFCSSVRNKWQHAKSSLTRFVRGNVMYKPTIPLVIYSGCRMFTKLNTKPITLPH